MIEYQLKILIFNKIAASQKKVADCEKIYTSKVLKKSKILSKLVFIRSKIDFLKLTALNLLKFMYG